MPLRMTMVVLTLCLAVAACNRPAAQTQEPNSTDKKTGERPAKPNNPDKDDPPPGRRLGDVVQGRQKPNNPAKTTRHRSYGR